jgi:hypothetical protein
MLELRALLITAPLGQQGSARWAELLDSLLLLFSKKTIF